MTTTSPRAPASPAVRRRRTAGASSGRRWPVTTTRRGSPASTRTPVSRAAGCAPTHSAVRFVEVVVNGPKSWSLAAELHPDIAAAYEAAQDRAAAQIIGWLASTRPPGSGRAARRSPSRSSELEAVTVRHYTSRAGDPHRHLHLQVNARVFAAGKWRGLDTVAFRDSINGDQRHRARRGRVRPGLPGRAGRARLHPQRRTGRSSSSRRSSGAFSKRAAQIAALLDRYEANGAPTTRVKNRGRGCGGRGTRGRGPTTGRTRSSRARVRELRQRWLAELAALGYRDRDKPIQLALPTARALRPGRRGRRGRARLGAAPVGVERRRHARRGRAAARPHRDRRRRRGPDRARRGPHRPRTSTCACRCASSRAPEHIRALTSRHVLDVEADLIARLAARGADPRTPDGRAAQRSNGWTRGSAAAVAALAGDARWSWWRARPAPARPRRSPRPGQPRPSRASRLVVVTPTLKAAQAATAEVGARAGSAAWLA